jgi:anthranilate phosphoribosyltransferase
MFAQAHHPAMRHAAPVRRELGTRTVFNVLGPLTNPARARAQVVGVYSAALVRPIAEALLQLGSRRAFVVHGAGGIDELSPIGPSVVAEVVDGGVRDRMIDPQELGLEPCSLEELAGGSPDENAAAIRRVFAGEQGGPRSAILLNAAGAIAAGGHAEDLREGIELARAALDSGAVVTRLEELIAFSRAEVVA